MTARVVSIVSAAVLLLACAGPDQSPFFLWDIRPGMPLDSVEQFLVQHDGMRPGQTIWERCDQLASGARRCEHRNASPWGQLDVVVGTDGRVLYLSFAPGTRSKAFDDSLSRMQQRWARARSVKMYPHGVSEENPRGIAEFRSGRWRAMMTFDGKLCSGTNLPCPGLIQILDWHAARQYVDTSTAAR